MYKPGIQNAIFSGKIEKPLRGFSTEPLLIIGTAQDGPLNEVVQITDFQQFEAIYGPANYAKGYKDPSDVETGEDAFSSIQKAVVQALREGAQNILVCRATGTYATAPSAFTNKLSLRSIYPGRIYNQVTFQLATSGTSVVCTVGQPSIKGGNFSITVPNTMTVSNFIDEVNENSKNRTVKILKNAWPSVLNSAVSTLGTGTVTLAGGTNGTRAPGEDYGPDAATGVNGYATALTTTNTGTFDMLRGARTFFSVAVLADIYVDDQVVNGGGANTTSIISDFVTFLDQCTIDINPCRGYISTRPLILESIAEIIDWVDNSLLSTSTGAYNATLRWIKPGPFLFNGWIRTDGQGQNVDSGARVVITAGSAYYAHPQLTKPFLDGIHLGAAAKATTFGGETSLTNKVLTSVLATPFDIPQPSIDKLTAGVGYSEADELSGAAAYMVLSRQPGSPNAPRIIYDDPTGAYRNDYFRQEQLVHLVNNILTSVNSVARGFIGQPNNEKTRAVLSNEIKNILDGYVNSGGLVGGKGVGYDYDIYSSGPDGNLGIVRVFLQLTPSRYIRTILVNTTVRSAN